MHPAYSVIAFTTASGAGYGLVALLAVFALAGLLPPTSGFGFVALGLAGALIGGGLLSSTLHLGRPERALGAFSQWRTSWLSREGVAAVAGVVPLAVFAFGWILLNTVGGVFGWMGALSALMSLAVVACTAMIYASLKPIRQWNNPLTLPNYLALAFATGALLLTPLTLAFQLYRPVFATLGLVALALAAAMKFAYWRAIDRAPPLSDLGSATGLSSFGAVRLLDAPHTEENFVMREMGFVIARAHAAKLRRIAALALFAAPAALTLMTLAAGGERPLLAFAFAALAALSGAAGVATERWLFFAEARHSAMIYYGRSG